MVQVVSFWIIAALLAAGAAALIFLALRARWAGAAGPDSNQANAAVYESRLEELQGEVDEGTLDAEDFDQAKTELERELLASIRSQGSAPAAAPPRGAAVAVAVLIPVLAVAIYLQLGSPETIGDKPPAPTAAAPASLEGLGDREALRRMTESFAQNLRENPEQGSNWLVLGRAYVMLKDYPKAVTAFSHASMLLGDEPDVLVDYAEAEALANGNRFSDAARGRIEKALSVTPEHEKGLWLGAFAAAQHGDPDVAISRWEQLRALANDPERVRIIDGLIARVQGAAQGAPPQAASPQPGAPAVTVQVSLSNALREGLSGDETVFILARAPDGSRVPLAVFRTTVKALPASVTLDDSLAMAPAFKISAQDRVMVVARVSISGNASARSGDLQGEAGPVPVGGDMPVEIVIDRRIP